jgi:hypothetical protein
MVWDLVFSQPQGLGLVPYHTKIRSLGDILG